MFIQKHDGVYWNSSVDESSALSITIFRLLAENRLTTAAVVWPGSGFQPLKCCRQFGSTRNHYMTIKMGDCAPTACQVHLTQPQKALMFTQEGTDDLQPDTLSLKTYLPKERFLILYQADDAIPRQLCGNGEITWCIGKILTAFYIMVCLLFHCHILEAAEIKEQQQLVLIQLHAIVYNATCLWSFVKWS